MSSGACCLFLHLPSTLNPVLSSRPQDLGAGPGRSRRGREHSGPGAGERHQSVSGSRGGHGQDQWTHQRGEGTDRWMRGGCLGPQEHREALVGECDGRCCRHNSIYIITLLWFVRTRIGCPLRNQFPPFHGSYPWMLLSMGGITMMSYHSVFFFLIRTRKVGQFSWLIHFSDANHIRQFKNSFLCKFPCLHRSSTQLISHFNTDWLIRRESTRHDFLTHIDFLS